LLALIERIAAVHQPKRLVFFDSYAPTDLRLAETLDPHIDFYVKKHVFRDRSLYNQSTRGDTNLMEYYGDRYDIDYPDTLFPIPNGFLDKMLVGPSFVTSRRIMSRLVAGRPYSLDKRIDVHARLAWEGSDWYSSMRQEAIGAIEKLEDLKVMSRPGVGPWRYMHELASSKICFSPFGYGEVAWRDYEAVICKSLLIKPDMSHVETVPDVFLPYETYVPVQWDFSDVEDRIRYYLAHPEEREAIVDRAFDLLHRYFRDGQFLRQMERVFVS
jgi:hypothetical protein